MNGGFIIIISGVLLPKIFLRIDLWRFNKLIAKLEKKDYDYLVSDRYYYDSLANIEYLTLNKCQFYASRNQKHKNILGSLAKYKTKILKPNLAIYLQTSPELIMQRERKPDQGLEYLRKKQEIYSNYATALKLKIIDGDRDKKKISEEIKNLLKLESLI